MRCRPFSKERGCGSSIRPDEYYEDYYAVFFLDPDGIEARGHEIRREDREAEAQDVEKEAVTNETGEDLH